MTVDEVRHRPILTIPSSQLQEAMLYGREAYRRPILRLVALLMIFLGVKDGKGYGQIRRSWYTRRSLVTRDVRNRAGGLVAVLWCRFRW